MKKILVLTIIGLLGLGLPACEKSEATPETAPNQYVEDVRRHRDFTAIKAGKAVKLEVTVSDEFAVVVESTEDGLADIKTEVEGDALVITSRPGRKDTGKPITVKVTLPQLNRLDIWGSSAAVARNVNSDTLTLQAGGDSIIEIEGVANTVKMVTTGVSKIDAEKLRTMDCGLKAAGASQIVVWTVNELTAETHGASRILYAEEPKKLTKSVIGSGFISKK